MKSNKNHSNDIENNRYDIFGDPKEFGSKPDGQSQTNSFSKRERKYAENLIREILDHVKTETEKRGIPEYYDSVLFEMERIASEESWNNPKIVKSTDKKKSIIIDQSGIMRNFAHDPDISFYSMSDPQFLPVNLNPFKIPYGIEPQKWIDMIVSLVAQSFSISNGEEGIFTEAVYELYQDQGIFDCSEADKFGGDDSREWKREITNRSEQVTFHRVYKKVETEMMEIGGIGRRDDILERNTYSDLLRRLSRFSRSYSIEYRLFSAEADFPDPNSLGIGYGLDEILKDGRITVFETKGMEKRMRKFAEGFVREGTEMVKNCSVTEAYNIHVLK